MRREFFRNGALESVEDVPDYVPTDREVAQADLRSQVQNAIDDMDAYLAIPSPTAGQVAQQVRRLTQIVRKILRLQQVS